MVQVQTSCYFQTSSIPLSQPQADLSLSRSQEFLRHASKMRTSLRLAAAGFLLVTLMTAMEAEAIRMDAESRAAVSRQMVAVNVSVFFPIDSVS
jgi:hypothetical protein